MVGLSEIKRQGSAKSGSHHWWMQRITAVLLVPLVLWFVLGLIIKLTGNPATLNETFVAWIRNPVATLIYLLLVITSIYHGTIGIQVVIEDYFHSKYYRTALIIFTRLFAFVTLVAAIVGILRIQLL